MDLDFKALAAAKTDDELADIYINPEKYNGDLVPFAEAELATRGIDLSPLDEKKRTKRINNAVSLDEGRKGTHAFMIVSFILAFFGGLWGIISGAIYAWSKRTGYNGERYYVYDKNTRSWGRMIFFLGITMLLIAYWIKKNKVSF